MDKKTIVVCGATGNQGGSVVQGLLNDSRWNVVALSRDPSSERAQAIKNKGVGVRKADLLDLASLRQAFANAYGVFGVTQPWSPDYKKINVQAEIKQGQNIVDACAHEGIKHLVLSSVIDVGSVYKGGVAHADSKILVQRYAEEKGIPHTMIKLSQFMDNIGLPFFPVKKGSVRGFVDANAKVPYIACRDIGIFTAMAFARPEDYIGKGLNLVGDFVSGEELALTLSKLRGGEPFKYTAIPKLLMWTLAKTRLMPKEFWEMRVAFERIGRPPYPKEILDSINSCRQLYPGIMSVLQCLKSKGYDTKKL